MSHQVHKEGWLWKVGGSVQSWKRRWMVLKQKSLLYYKTESDAHSGNENPQGAVALDGASVAALLDNNEFSSSHSAHGTSLFGITPPHSSRMYVIQAASPVERDMWIAACAAAGAFRITLSQAGSRTQADSLLEGWLDKSASTRFGGSFGSIFGQPNVDRYYFCLFCDKLALWKSNQTSSAALDQVLLFSDTILVNGKPSPEHGPPTPFELVSRKGEAKWLLTADTAAHKDVWVEAIRKTIAGERFEYAPYVLQPRTSVVHNGPGMGLAFPSHGSFSASSSTTPVTPASAPAGATTPASPAASVSVASPATQVAPPSAGTAAGKYPRRRRDSGPQSDDEEDGEDDEGPPPLPMQRDSSGSVSSVHGVRTGGGLLTVTADESDDERDMDEEAVSSNAHVAEASPAPSLDFFDAEGGLMSPPPPLPEDEDSEPPPPPPPPAAGDLSAEEIAAAGAVVAQQPDVLLQLSTLLTTRFAGDPRAMQQYLDSFVKDAVARTALAPPRASVDCGIVAPAVAPHKPVQPPRMLHVHLLEARGLPAMDSNGYSDPYVILHVRSSTDKKLTGGKLKSKTCLETLDPVWDQQITLDLPSWADELVLDMYDYDKLSVDDFIGRVVVPLSSLREHHSSQSGWHALGGIKDPWVTVGSVFFTLVLDNKFVPEGTRNSVVTNMAFLTSRSHLLLATEQRYFAAQMQKASPVPTLNHAGSVAPTVPGSGGLCAAEQLRVFCGTWNVGNAPPPDDLSSWIPLYRASLYVIGSQECNYPPRRDAKSCKSDWQLALVRHFGRDYTLIKYTSLWEIRVAVFVANTHLPHVSNVAAASEATGIANVLGNKGGAMVSLHYRSLKLCFLNSHLAAHQGTCDLRNGNYRSIVRNIKVGPAGGGDVLNEFHHTMWMGDLNYRLDYGGQGDAKSPSPVLFAEMVDKIASGRSDHREELWSCDQLSREKGAQRAFVGFREGSYDFPPTFKVKRAPGTEYTPQRSPAWCDRVLVRSVPGYPLELLSLAAAPAVATSDHKPVVAFYDLAVPVTPCPLDRGLGAAVVRLHDLRCSGFRVVKEGAPAGGGAADPAAAALQAAKELDPFLVFNAPFLAQPVVTPVAKRSAAPSWLELPPAPASYNALARLRSSLLYVRVCNHQSQDAVVGRAIISLTDLHPAGFENEEEAAAAAAAGCVANSAAAAVAAEHTATGGPAPSSSASSSKAGASSAISSSSYAYRGLPHTKRFEVDVTFAGVPAGTISGSITFMFKQRSDKK